MFKLLKGGDCYIPEFIGKKDILIAGKTICKIEDNIPVDNLWDVEKFDCTGKIVCPGFIDQHLHITGGGGEQGPSSRIPELMLGEIIKAGVSTVVGVLGVDDISRNIAGLLAKARALEIEGVTTYIYTGSYGVPTATLTGRVISDISLIDKVIGVGEIAIADYRASHRSLEMLKGLAYEAKVGGLLGAKAGVMHMHVGDGKEGLKELFLLVEESDFPIDMFVPTHLNRNKALFEQSINYAEAGGNIDLTAGEASGQGLSVPEALEILVRKGINMDKVTVSSDGNGSIPGDGTSGSGVGKVVQLFNDIKTSITDKKIEITQALKTVTSNVAKVLKLYPQKGILQAGSDADILVLDKSSLNIDLMLGNGDLCVKDGKVIKRGKYENRG
ncbi:MAG: beta-aspartyl-peptidase [Clostridia bacterium]|nr:beta-aspartyl-peptidase [Clostridia bacterium]